MPGIIPNAEIRAVQAAGNPPLPTLRGRVEAAHKGLLHVSELLEGVIMGPFHVLPPALAPLEEMRKNSPDPRVLQGRISWKKKISGLHLGLTKGNIAVREETQLDYLKVPSGFQKCVQKSVRDS